MKVRLHINIGTKDKSPSCMSDVGVKSDFYWEIHDLRNMENVTYLSFSFGPMFYECSKNYFRVLLNKRNTKNYEFKQGM